MSADDVLQFLRMLENAPKSRRNWRVLQCHCRGCGDLAVEVFRTPVGTAPLVAVHTGLKRPDEGRTHSVLGVDDKGVRASDPTVSVLMSANQDGLHVACKCGKRVVPAAVLINAVRSGDCRVVLDTPD